MLIVLCYQNKKHETVSGMRFSERWGRGLKKKKKKVVVVDRMKKRRRNGKKKNISNSIEW